jgi:hypothetical protein
VQRHRLCGVSLSLAEAGWSGSLLQSCRSNGTKGVCQRAVFLFTWLGQSGRQLAVAPHLEKPEGSLKHHNLGSAISAAIVDPHLRFSPSPFPVSGQSCCAVVVSISLHRNPFDTDPASPSLDTFAIDQITATAQPATWYFGLLLWLALNFFLCRNVMRLQ